MSRMCMLCGKQAVRANSVSHSNRKTPRQQKPNLQFLTIANTRVKVCSGCRRTIARQTV